MENLEQKSEVEQLELKPLWEIYTDLKPELLQRDGTVKHPTGLHELDRATFGMWKRELMVMGARPGQGKSMLALHLAKTLADNNQKVIFFSLEMSKESLCERLITNICEINNLDLREGVAHDLIEERSKLFLDWAENVKLLIDDRNGHSFQKIVQVVKEITPDWVFVDYVQLISMKGFKDKLSALEEFVKELHRMGKHNNFGTILVSQLNRQGVDHSGVHHLKAGGILEEHADQVWLLDWDKLKNEYLIRVEKNRHGAMARVNVSFKPQYSMFEDGHLQPPIQRKDWGTKE